ncbi:ABC transporter substrate-binding protein, partial [Candidatus Woesearchaeota archaeon]|nr:ABC transporter substrate-binding protein [Candidatus Woesearchaeota archaeon]
ANKKIIVVPNTNYGKLSDYLFTTDLELKKEAEFLAKQLWDKGITKVGVMYLNNDWGVQHKEYFTREFKELGGEITGVETFGFGVSDYRTIIAKITEDKPQAIFVAYSFIGPAIVQIRELGLDVQIVGQRGNENPSTLDIAGVNAEDFIFSAVAEVQQGNLIESQTKFHKEYTKRFNQEISHVAANSYDALTMVANAIQECKGSDTECMRQNILTSEFDGASGRLRIDPKINGVVKSVTMKTVKGGEFVLLE